MGERRDLVDFHLPDEILAVIPTDPYDQLDVARKITSMAIASRVTRLESESTRLRQQIAERDRTVEELKEKVANLDRIAEEYSMKLKIALEENAKLTRERDYLSFTSRKLSRNLSKLETFKKQLIRTISEDNLTPKSESYEIDDPYDNLVARVPSWQVDKEESSTSLSGFASVSTISAGSNQNGKELSITPYNITSNPKMSTNPNSPKKSSLDGNNSSAMSAWYPSSQTAPVSPPNRRSFTGRPHMDGKEFFRQARTRLSYEQFGSFLANVKEFNSTRQSREETLRKAEEIFGMENNDLYILFQNMINRNQS
ncbi:hypothetical protein LUZ60_009010 [Juncus effusus]|nr:hypothetical protein LUZ60_009010 [Juncus effusus]